MLITCMYSVMDFCHFSTGTASYEGAEGANALPEGLRVKDISASGDFYLSFPLMASTPGPPRYLCPHYQFCLAEAHAPTIVWSTEYKEGGGGREGVFVRGSEEIYCKLSGS